MRVIIVYNFTQYQFSPVVTIETVRRKFTTYPNHSSFIFKHEYYGCVIFILIKIFLKVVIPNIVLIFYFIICCPLKGRTCITMMPRYCISIYCHIELVACMVCPCFQSFIYPKLWLILIIQRINFQMKFSNILVHVIIFSAWKKVTWKVNSWGVLLTDMRLFKRDIIIFADEIKSK